MTTTPAKNPILSPGSTDIPEWVQLTPKGTFWHDDAEVFQLIDDRAIDAMVNRLNAEKTAAGDNWAGLLVDFDHFSNDQEKSSEAAAWLMGLENRADGMWGQPRFSDVGATAVKGLRFRFTSPVWKPSDCEVVNRETSTIRPLRLDRAALTNDPRLKGMAPLTNRAEVEKFHPAKIVEIEIEEVIENRACTKDMLLNYGTSAGAKKGWETRRAGGMAGSKSSLNKVKASKPAPEPRAATKEKLASKTGRKLITDIRQSPASQTVSPEIRASHEAARAKGQLEKDANGNTIWRKDSNTHQMSGAYHINDLGGRNYAVEKAGERIGGASSKEKAYALAEADHAKSESAQISPRAETSDATKAQWAKEFTAKDKEETAKMASISKSQAAASLGERPRAASKAGLFAKIKEVFAPRSSAHNED